MYQYIEKKNACRNTYYKVDAAGKQTRISKEEYGKMAGGGLALSREYVKQVAKTEKTKNVKIQDYDAYYE